MSNNESAVGGLFAKARTSLHVVKESFGPGKCRIKVVRRPSPRNPKLRDRNDVN